MGALAPFGRGFGVAFGLGGFTFGFALGGFGSFALGSFAFGGFAFDRLFATFSRFGLGDFGGRHRRGCFDLGRGNLGLFDLGSGHRLFFRCLFAASQPYDQEAGENRAPYTRAPQTRKCAVDHV